eukprot:6461827-Prymnesium_polylepis.1
MECAHIAHVCGGRIDDRENRGRPSQNSRAPNMCTTSVKNCQIGTLIAPRALARVGKDRVGAR